MSHTIVDNSKLRNDAGAEDNSVAEIESVHVGEGVSQRPDESDADGEEASDKAWLDLAYLTIMPIAHL